MERAAESWQDLVWFGLNRIFGGFLFSCFFPKLVHGLTRTVK